MKSQFILIILLLSIIPTYALELDQEITDEEKATFDQISKPIMKICHLSYSSLENNS